MNIDLDTLLEKMKKANASYIRIELDDISVFVVTSKEGADEMSKAWDEYAEE